MHIKTAATLLLCIRCFCPHPSAERNTMVSPVLFIYNWLAMLLSHWIVCVMTQRWPWLWVWFFIYIWSHGPDSLINRPFQCRDILECFGGFGKWAVSCKRFVVQELPHGNVGKLLHQLKGVIDVEEYGKEMFSVACADSNTFWKDQSGILLQLGHICPWNYQGHWGWDSRISKVENN